MIFIKLFSLIYKCLQEMGVGDLDRIRRGNSKRKQSREDQKEILVQQEPGLLEPLHIQSERQKLSV